MAKRFLWFTGSLLLAVLLFGAVAEAQQVPSAVTRAGRFVFGAGVGLQGDTVDDTAFALGVSGDYFLNNNLSIGPLLQIGLTGDLFQLGLTAQAKYTFDLPDMPAIKPHIEAGIGFIYADLDRPSGRSGDDTSFLIPLGVGLEYRLSSRISLDTTLFFNFTDLDVRGGNDNFFITWLVGVRIPF
jgi:opacity protein-like surface antigen